MDEKRYLELVDVAFRRINDAFDDIDPEDADLESRGDVITIALRNGRKIVINTQRPVRQIWLAGGARAWHFSYSADGGSWIDDKGSGAELFDTLLGIFKAETGITLHWR